MFIIIEISKKKTLLFYLKAYIYNILEHSKIGFAFFLVNVFEYINRVIFFLNAKFLNLYGYFFILIIFKCRAYFIVG